MTITVHTLMSNLQIKIKQKDRYNLAWTKYEEE